MIYQSDSFIFTLSLFRPDTSVVSTSAVSNDGTNSTYTYTLTSGPALHLGTKIVITGSGHTENNGTFTIIGLGSGTFKVANVSGTTQTENATGTVGTAPNVTTSPVLQIIRLSDFVAVLGSPASMIALDSSKQLWAYSWDVGTAATGEYMAIVSYAVDGNTFNSVPLEKVRIGDTRVIGIVAQDSTVAKDGTVAKDATVAHATDISQAIPDNSPIIQAIKAKTDNLPVDPTGMTLLADAIQDIADVHDGILGNQSVDKTQNPAVLTVKRLDNSVLANYQLSDDSTTTSKTKF